MLNKKITAPVNTRILTVEYKLTKRGSKCELFSIGHHMYMLVVIVSKEIEKIIFKNRSVFRSSRQKRLLRKL